MVAAPSPLHVISQTLTILNSSQKRIGCARRTHWWSIEDDEWIRIIELFGRHVEVLCQTLKQRTVASTDLCWCGFDGLDDALAHTVRPHFGCMYRVEPTRASIFIGGTLLPWST